MSSVNVPAVSFLDSGTYYITRANTPEAQQPITRRLFKAHYYLEPLGFQVLWNRLSNCIPNNQVENGVHFSTIQPTTDLLWALHYVFVYSSEDMSSVFFSKWPPKPSSNMYGPCMLPWLQQVLHWYVILKNCVHTFSTMLNTYTNSHTFCQDWPWQQVHEEQWFWMSYDSWWDWF